MNATRDGLSSLRPDVGCWSVGLLDECGTDAGRIVNNFSAFIERFVYLMTNMSLAKLSLYLTFVRSTLGRYYTYTCWTCTRFHPTSEACALQAAIFNRFHYIRLNTIRRKTKVTVSPSSNYLYFKYFYRASIILIILLAEKWFNSNWIRPNEVGNWAPPIRRN